MRRCRFAVSRLAFITFVALVHVIASDCHASTASLALLCNKLQDGDIVFQQSKTPQSTAIRQATGSPWTHMGLILGEQGNVRLIEAGVNGVAYTSLGSFVGRSRNRRVIVKRLKDQSVLTPEARARMRASLSEDLGKEYDNLFEWTNEKIYCSELVWRAYQRGVGISIGSVQRVRQLHYQEPAVRALIKERYRLSGSQIEASSLLDENIVTPASILNSNVLETVFDGVVIH
jgi:Permuted papain-like amidase enzyme, YaeF/YiiX, C92 family